VNSTDYSLRDNATYKSIIIHNCDSNSEAAAFVAAAQKQELFLPGFSSDSPLPSLVNKRLKHKKLLVGLLLLPLL
jgi:hypothetical protein